MKYLRAGLITILMLDVLTFAVISTVLYQSIKVTIRVIFFFISHEKQGV